MVRELETPQDTDWFRVGLDGILSRYLKARSNDRLDSSHSLWEQGKSLQRNVEMSGAVRPQSHLKVRWSFGQGNWARIPWLALLDDRVARATSAGVYVIYLFREDMSGVYATLNQGISKEKAYLGAVAGRNLVRRRSEDLRSFAASLVMRGFVLSNDIDLRTNHSLANDYEHGTVAHRLYEADKIPPTSDLLVDLGVLLDVYEMIASSSNVRSAYV